MPYVTRRGQRRKRPAGATNGVQYLVKLEGTVATFECKTGGHRTRHDYSKGPVYKRLPASALQRFARYWGLGPVPEGATRGHCYGWCQRCQDEFDREEGHLKDRPAGS